MSAIWGHIDFNSTKCSVATMASEYSRKCILDRITEKSFKNALFGSGLQYINAEDENEDMPYYLESSQTLITTDCILDNRDELAKELSTGDTSLPDGRLVCLAYEKWGKDLVHHLKGIYSVAIYDMTRKELFLFTDRTSSRCLYYYKDQDSCTFSTLISPIKELYPNIPRNEMYLKDFLLVPGLMPNISSTETPWENLYIIEAGCTITITESSVKSDRYWSPEKLSLSRNIDKLKEAFLDTYKTAVGRAIRTNKGVAIALSGGFDSASVAAMAAPLLQKEEKQLISYTYVPHYDMSGYYPKNRITNESAYVKEIAKMYPNIETNFTDNDGKSFFGYMEELLDVMEIPFKAFVNLPFLLEIYRSASNRGCKIFLNGQTGNASVSYGNIDSAIYELLRQKKYIKAARYLNNYCKIAGISRKKAFPSMLKYLNAIDIKTMNIQEELTEEIINPFVNPKLLKEYSFAKRNQSGMPLSIKDSVDTKEKLKYEVYTLPALSYIGAMETKLGLYTGIVIRDATRDADVLSFCNSYPYEYYSYNGIPRYLIRGFMKDMLPKCILYPILKTGIQGSDWIIRLQNPKETIFRKIKHITNNSLTDSTKYVCSEKLQDFLDSPSALDFENSNELVCAFIIYLYSLYLKETTQNKN